MSKRALLVGCNYPGTKCELYRCANDVRRMKELLLQRLSFDEVDILVMLDSDPSLPSPTGKNIRRCLAKLIKNTHPGDCLVFHYSGHEVPAESGEVDNTGSNEAIVPTDVNLFTDDDFRDLVNKIPVGVTFPFLSDSCHSGGLIDSTKEQIGNTVMNYANLPSNTGDKSNLFGLIGTGIDAFDGKEEEEPKQKSGFQGFLSKAKAKVKDHTASCRHDGDDNPVRPDTLNFNFESQNLQETGHQVKNKNLDINTLTEILSQRTRHEVKVVNMRTTIFDMFGDDASPKVKVFVNVIFTQLQIRRIQ